MRDVSGDLVLSFGGVNLSGLLEDATVALAEAVGMPGDGTTVVASIEVAVVDIEALVVGWLNELIALVDIQGVVPVSAQARVEDDPSRPERYTAAGQITARKPARGYSPLVLPKAATYHGIAIRKMRAGWTGRVILDL